MSKLEDLEYFLNHLKIESYALLSRMDSTKQLEGGRWVTTEEGHRIYVKKGKIVAGNLPKNVLEKIQESPTKEPEKQLSGEEKSKHISILKKLAAVYNHPSTSKSEAEAAKKRSEEISKKYGLDLEQEEKKEEDRVKTISTAIERHSELRSMSKTELVKIVIDKKYNNEVAAKKLNKEQLVSAVWNKEFPDDVRDKAKNKMYGWD